MHPSTFYEDEEKTYAGGFNYKVTTSGINALYSLNDELDESIAYTTPKNSGLDVMNMGGWNNTSASAYVDKQLYFSKDYGSSGHSNINSLTVSKGSFAETGATQICFAANPGAGYYYFGNAADASETRGSLNCKLITDMEINKIIFKASIPTGWTKEDFDAFESNGSLADGDGYEISIADFMAHPENYYIRTFTISALAYWDGSTWRANNLTNSPQIAPVFLTSNTKTTGFLTFNKHHFDNSPGTGEYGVSNVSVYNSSATNATNVNAWKRGVVTSGLSSSSGYILGSAETIQLTPDLTAEQCMDLTGDGILGAGTTLPAKTLPIWDALKIFKYDQYTLTADSGSSGPSHFTRYNYYFCVGMRGDYLYKLLAYIGAYFYTGSLNDLNDSGATPDNLAVTGMRLGEMDGEGFTTGRWIGPDAMADYQGINKGGSIVHPGYNPSPTPSGTDEDNTDPIPVAAAPYSSGLARYYVTTAGSVILSHISQAMGTWNLKDTGKDLYKNIISCKLIKSPAPIPVSGSEPFTVYGVTLQYEGSDITLPLINDNPTASFGSYNIPRKFYDFRDYAPYTKVEIYLPYCGWTVLPSHVVGRSVSVTYYTDIIAATCKAVVYCGSNVIAEAAGVIGLDIPMVTENAGAKAEAVTMGLLAYGKAGLQTALGVGAAVATKGKAGVKQAVSGLSDVVSAYSQTAMAFNQNYTEINGKNGDGCCIAGISAIVIKITRPKYGSNTTAPYVPSEYPHSTGFVSMKSGTVGSFTGLLVADNVDTSGISGATDREKQLIKLYLESGIYVNHPN